MQKKQEKRRYIPADRYSNTAARYTGAPAPTLSLLLQSN